MTQDDWSRLSEFIADKMGLHFPPERWPDLQRGLAGAAEEFGIADVASCIGWLLSAPLTKVQLQVLASHLTVGETYFFREQKAFDALAENVLPELIHSRRKHGQRLRIWSAACCTGEEPYSLAILLHQLIPDLRDWHVTILATDINSRFLHKAAAGVYGKWSFRDAPAGFKERYFRRAANDRYAILPEIKKLVTFAHTNLVDDAFPSLATDTNAMDVIFCRNVLMYFTQQQARKVIQHLHRSLVEDGWLAVSPSESSQAMFSQFAPVNFAGAILYQKGDAPRRTIQNRAAAVFDEPLEWTMPETISARMPSAPTTTPFESPQSLPADEQLSIEPPPTVRDVAAALYEEGRYEEAADTLLAAFAGNSVPDPQLFSLLARALANQGKLTEAQTWCDRWIAADKLDSSGHYLRAVVLQELGEAENARRSLQRAIYLQPTFVLAHFALGNLARTLGNSDEADKHFANALNLLRDRPPEEALPESDGLTAGRLNKIITSLVALEASP